MCGAGSLVVLLATPEPLQSELARRLAGPTGISDLAGRRFLIITAPFGPFGSVLAARLEAGGARVNRILLNAGDELYWRRPGGLRFKQPAKAWEAHFLSLVSSYSDIVIFGEGGPYNQAAIRNASSYAARLWVLENGYFRPDWITIERNGVNASSNLPRDRSGYDAPAPEIPEVRPVGRILPYHVLNITLHHLIQLPGRWKYPRFVAPYTQAPWLQCAGHIRRYFSLAFQSPSRVDADRIAAGGPFFIICLQRDGDAQLLRYSAYPDNAAFLAEVMSSFASHAPPEARLVVKNHPLDPGLTDLGQITRGLAVERGLSERVEFIDGGNMAQLCRLSRGMVVNNSSAALSALGFRTPVKVLGKAFFDFEGLTDQKPLDRFWSEPQTPDSALFTRFRAHVISHCQINGSYHEPRMMETTAKLVAERFARADP